jgi:hypothetical protein
LDVVKWSILVQPHARSLAVSILSFRQLVLPLLTIQITELGACQIELKCYHFSWLFSSFVVFDLKFDCKMQRLHHFYKRRLEQIFWVCWGILEIKDIVGVACKAQMTVLKSSESEFLLERVFGFRVEASLTQYSCFESLHKLQSHCATILCTRQNWMSLNVLCYK